MSGVRIRNTRLLSLGMTLPGFVERGKVIASLPSLGVLTVAACLPPNWQPIYTEVDQVEPGTLEGLLAYDADLYAISSLAARIDAAYSLADALRSAGKTVVIGGLHASSLPDEAILHADAVVVGEGERCFPQLVQDLEEGKLRAHYSSRMETGPVYTFETAPLPRYDLLDVDRYNRLTLQTTRGCPLDCSFCAASRLISPYRRKPLERIERELGAILDIWPTPFLELADDNTFVNKKWGKDLARLIGSHRIRWFTETDISVADDEDLLELLARSGCAQLLIGLESIDMSALDQADTRGWKKRKRAEYLARIQKIQSYGISVNGCFVLGFDSDTPSVFESTRDFVLESELTEVQITVLTPFPATKLYRDLRADGRLPEQRYWERCTLFDVVFRPARMSPERLEEGLHWLAGELYREDRTAERKGRLRTMLRSATRDERQSATF